MSDAVGWRDKARLPWISRASELYQVHLNRERRLVPAGAARYLPDPGRLAESIEEMSHFDLREQIRTGLMQESWGPGEFRLTFVGAWRAVYRFLPPWKELRLRRAFRASRADHADALASPAPRPEGVTVTSDSPFAPR
jgi:hypothetical protein